VDGFVAQLVERFVRNEKLALSKIFIKQSIPSNPFCLEYVLPPTAHDLMRDLGEELVLAMAENGENWRKRAHG